MIFQDILINCNLQFSQLAEGISVLFSINLSELLVVEQITEEAITQHILILYQVQNIEGYFSQLISSYGQFFSLETSINKSLSDFCKKYKCECLISNSSINPYSMTLVKGVDNYQTVYLSPAELLDEEKYIISQFEENV